MTWQWLHDDLHITLTMPITLGLEEELQVVGAATLALEPHDIEAGRIAVPDDAGTSSCEIHHCALEVQTPVCQSVDELLDCLSKLRTMAARRADKQGQLVLAAGLHPFSDWRTQSLRDDPVEYPHYARLLTEYVDVARGAMSFGLHLHFGLPDPTRRIAVMNRLREVLPDILALSASSPFVEGRDTGMQTWRHALLDRYPRMGVPEVWASEDQYFAHVDRLRSLGIIGGDQGLWEDMRLHHRYGTIEVRICDATPSLDRNWLIAALLLCEVDTLDREVAQGRARDCLRPTFVAENRWRARRHGLSATLVDWHRDELVAAPVRFSRWLERLAPSAERLGLMSRLSEHLTSALVNGTSADAQRSAAAGGDMRQVVQHLVTETSQPLANQLLRECA
jgi:carboxylate-amine ligase